MSTQREPLAPIPHNQEMATIYDLAPRLSRAGLATTKRPVEQIVAIALMGREIGIPIMAALQGIHIIQGQPALSVHLTSALLARGGVKWQELERSDKRCAVKFTRPGWEPLVAEFTWSDAERAKLVGKDNWRNYPKSMLWSRAFQDGARRIGPDLLAGFAPHTAEELGETTDPNGDPVPEVTSTLPEPSSANERARSELVERIGRFGEAKRKADGPKAFTADDERQWLDRAEGELAKGVELDVLLEKIDRKIADLEATVNQTETIQ